MRHTRAVLIALAAMFGIQTGNLMAQQLAGSDRLLLYYYSFNKQRADAQTIQLQQRRIANDFYQFRSAQLSAQDQARRAGDPIERMIRGNPRSRNQRRTPPAIYSGFGGSQQYFSRANYFNPPATGPLPRR